ncbi:MAG: hypothetical protein LBU42_06470 [Prevotellaceae bacterium]|jgi:hypothetical protein|nr:hypothetical protein [Prevotellaceae bacterium]
MKTKLFFFAMLASVVASAQRTTPVTIANTKVDYATKIVTFDLSWKGSDYTHRNEVWVFVDIQPVTGANTLGGWSPATLVPSATTVTGISGNQYTALTHTIASGNMRGTWVKGTASNTTSSFAATVKLMLDPATPAKFNACAYVSDYPPNAASLSGSVYTLKGSQPFVVNGGTISDNTFTGAIHSLTDATGCPGGIARDVPNNGGNCLTGLTAVNGYCRDVAADGAHVKCGLEFIALGNTTSSYCPSYVPAGWRLMTYDEACCAQGGPGTWCIQGNDTCRVPNCAHMGNTICTCAYVR